MIAEILRKIISNLAASNLQCQGGKLTPQQRKGIVDAHNSFRSSLINGSEQNRDNETMPRGKNMLKLTWDCNLEKSAQQWADNCRFKHSPRQYRQNAGENLYMYSSKVDVSNKVDTIGVQASNSWWSELPKFYHNNPSNIMTEKVFNQRVGHFTQMAWGATYKIGCGIAAHCESKRLIIVVCQYKVSGNMIDSKIYEIGDPCKKDSDCDTKKCSAADGLCIKE
ncbi:unnamed protein product [Thelazia callipaeda]|uniref:SCP domain-containing protein n=1 Tax=Thelazia callipaeda TaxID=103827 RepID=A0A0N5DBH6_THECL|nr:unnamed protein product [Thelazia callipaeda]